MGLATDASPVASAQRRAENRARGLRTGHGRVRARPILPGARYKITRRCLGRQFFLVPSEPLNQIIGYWLGVCLERHGVLLHAACFMSNHLHLDVTDPHGVLPEFKADFNAVLARAVNALRGRFDRFWSADRPCDVRLLDDDDVVQNMVYTLANPTSAGLVKWGRRWPGFTTAGHPFGTRLEFAKPSVFFDAGGKLPDLAVVTVTRPDIHSEMSDAALYAELVARTRDRETEKQLEMRRSGRRFLGEARVLRQRWRDSPRSREARFTGTPTLSAKNRWARAAQLRRDRRWEAAYSAAREQLIGGDLAAVFPAGTYWLRRFVGVSVALGP